MFLHLSQKVAEKLLEMAAHLTCLKSFNLVRPFNQCKSLHWSKTSSFKSATLEFSVFGVKRICYFIITIQSKMYSIQNDKITKVLPAAYADMH